jgi:hypothetical protein
MARGLVSAGRIGLAANLNKRESARQDMDTLSRLVQMKEQDEQAEMQAALAEQQYYERIRQETDKMLEGDRMQINKKAKAIQRQISDNIKLFGGSRKKFLASGGLGMLNDYSNTLLDSEEVQTYKANKVNLEKILDLKEKGMSDLILPRDMQALEDYQRNGRGTITYGGVMNQIEMPPNAAFTFGENAETMDIVMYKNNKTKLLGNMMMENPDKDYSKLTQEQLDNEIMAYASAKGYSVPGTTKDTTRMGGATSGVTSPRTSGSSKPAEVAETISGNLAYIFAKDPGKTTSFEDMSKGITHESNNPLLGTMIGHQKFDVITKVEPSLLERFGEAVHDKIPGMDIAKKYFGVEYDLENRYMVRGGVSFDGQMARAAAEHVFGQMTPDDEGYMNIQINGGKGEYFGNGVLIENAEAFKNSRWKVEGMVGGYKANIQNKDAMIMDAIDEHGNIAEDRQETMYDSYNKEAQVGGREAMFLLLKDQDGNMIYKEVPYEGYISQNNFGQSVEKHVGSNDLSDEFKENYSKTQRRIEEANKVKIERGSRPKIKVEQPIFQSPLFEQQIRQNFNFGTNGSRRMNLAKAFYLAMAQQGKSDIEQMVTKDYFSTFVGEIFGFEKELKSKQITDSQLLNGLEQQIYAPQHSETADQLLKNRILIQTMRNYLNNLRTQ